MTATLVWQHYNFQRFFHFTGLQTELNFQYLTQVYKQYKNFVLITVGCLRLFSDKWLAVEKNSRLFIACFYSLFYKNRAYKSQGQELCHAKWVWNFLYWTTASACTQTNRNTSFCAEVSTKTKTKVNAVNIYSIAVVRCTSFLFHMLLLVNCIYIADLPAQNCF